MTIDVPPAGTRPPGREAFLIPRLVSRGEAHGLLGLGLVRREVPFGEDERSGKRALYKIVDPFFRSGSVWWLPTGLNWPAARLKPCGNSRPLPPLPSRLADAEIVRAFFVPEVSGKPGDILKATGSLVLTARDLLAGSAEPAKHPG